MSKEKLLKAKFNGDIEIGDTKIDASVLEDGTRVLSYRSTNRALGKSEKWSSKDGALELPPFLSSRALIPFISKDLMVPLKEPVEYKPLHGGRSAYGVPATLLPEVCDIWLKARDAGALTTKKDLRVAKQAEILMRALAHIGIIALVDEATGYQEVRDKQELQLVLKKYIAKELLQWSLRFPPQFYEEMFRLKGWDYNAQSKQRKPMLAGKLTKELIYDQLPDGVIEEIKKKNPKRAKGGLHKNHHHRYLTPDIGMPHLDKQIATVTTLMRISPNWRTFQQHFRRAFGKQRELDLTDKDTNE